MRTFIKTAAAAILGASALLPLAASAHDHGRRGPDRYERYERYDRYDHRYYDRGPRVVERTVIYREVPPPRVMYREPRVIYREPVYVAPMPVYGRPAITIGVSVPPIVIPLR
ncbi:MAG: hypothetical protein QM639_00810 [Rhodocyclaceae bacterium]